MKAVAHKHRRFSDRRIGMMLDSEDGIMNHSLRGSSLQWGECLENVRPVLHR